MLKREHRLHRRAEFRAAYRGGRVYGGSLLRLYVLRGGSGKKAAVVTSKRVGGAVVRNRMRRLVSESVRLLYPWIDDGVSLVFVARGGSGHAPFEKVSTEVRDLLEKAGVLGHE